MLLHVLSIALPVPSIALPAGMQYDASVTETIQRSQVMQQPVATHDGQAGSWDTVGLPSKVYPILGQCTMATLAMLCINFWQSHIFDSFLSVFVFVGLLQSLEFAA